jgi:ADP-ribosylglycohydrolase
MKNELLILRAQGCLLGQLAGDALGSLVEFQTASQIKAAYPNGVRELKDGGTWNTIAGQPTDDSEMALILARMLVKEKIYEQASARQAYQYWLSSNPFCCGKATAAGLRGQPDFNSQANGALMRISPLGIFGTNFDLEQVALWAKQDAEITHPHPICLQTNMLFAMSIAEAIRTETKADEVYQQILVWAKELKVDDSLIRVIQDAANNPPRDYIHQQGWVLIALQNALWQLLHTHNLEDALVDTVMRGGDTDTNAAICGALLGAVYGLSAIPEQWRNTILNCRLSSENSKVKHPRPECFWPNDALELAESLLQ